MIPQSCFPQPLCLADGDGKFVIAVDVVACSTFHGIVATVKQPPHSRQGTFKGAAQPAAPFQHAITLPPPPSPHLLFLPNHLHDPTRHHHTMAPSVAPTLPASRASIAAEITHYQTQHTRLLHTLLHPSPPTPSSTPIPPHSRSYPPTTPAHILASLTWYHHRILFLARLRSTDGWRRAGDDGYARVWAGVRGADACALAAWYGAFLMQGGWTDESCALMEVWRGGAWGDTSKMTHGEEIRVRWDMEGGAGVEEEEREAEVEMEAARRGGVGMMGMEEGAEVEMG
ncbi:hypothetical protein EDC01DRAFT_630598 [Geopyxis carbonaria]|nr:hypothetical protein EDC01DRAFT_630598 [Geopyxis carbonaria]